MMGFVSLIQNEWMKINSKRQSWFFYLFLITFVLLAGLIIFFFLKSLADNIGAADFTNYMNTAFGIFITIYMMVMGAQIITDEYRDGTIKQLLIRPAGRAAILGSKYVTLLLLLLATYAILYVFSLLLGAILFGIDNSGATPGSVLGSILYQLPGLVFFVTLSFFMAVVFKSLGLAISISIVANFIGGVLTGLLSKYEWSKFIIFANTDLTVYSKNTLISSGARPFKEGMTLGFSLTVIVVYVIVLYVLANWIFARRDVQ